MSKFLNQILEYLFIKKRDPNVKRAIHKIHAWHEPHFYSFVFICAACNAF